MKKLLSLLAVAAVIAVAGAVNANAQDAICVNVSTFATAATTTTPTAVVIPASYTTSRITGITLSWNVTATTNTVYLYDRIAAGATAPRLVYAIKLSTGGTVCQHVLNLDGYGLKVTNGLMAVASGTEGSPVLNVLYR